MSEQPKAPDTNIAGCCGGIIVVLVAFAVWGALSGDPKDSVTNTDTHNWRSAYATARQFVRDSLKSPSTADFPMPDQSYVEDLGGGKYRVRAYVDAENAFGAKLRSDWMVVEHWVGGGNYALDDIAVNAR